MIANKDFRRKGLAKEAISLVKKYLAENKGKGIMVAKIKKSNKNSIEFFKSCGFEFYHDITAFESVELHCKFGQ